MLKVKFGSKDRPLKRILCLGAHSDDLEIGCGGTILRLLAEHKDLEVFWIVFGSNEERAREAFKSASVLLRQARKRRIVIKDFRDGFFPYIGEAIKEYFEQLKKDYSPDLIFTHYRDDLHQDHRLISELTWNTYRHHLILEYEVPKYDGDLGAPNFFVHLSESTCRRKVKHILQTFHTQKGRHWFTEDTFLSLLRLRGVESSAPGKYAEAFYSRKVVL